MITLLQVAICVDSLYFYLMIISVSFLVVRRCTGSENQTAETAKISTPYIRHCHYLISKSIALFVRAHTREMKLSFNEYKRFKEHNENRNFTLRELTFKVDTQLVSRIQCHPLAKLQIKLLKINSCRPDELQAKKTNVHISQITEPLTLHSPGNKRYKYNSFLTKLHNPQTHDPSQILKQHRNVLMTIFPKFWEKLSLWFERFEKDVSPYVDDICFSVLH